MGYFVIFFYLNFMEDILISLKNSPIYQKYIFLKISSAQLLILNRYSILTVQR